MKQYKVWAVFTAGFMWLLLAINVNADGLPEFTKLVSDNAAAVVNISTTTKNDDQQQMRQLPPNVQIPEGSPFDDLLKRYFQGPNEGGPMPYDGPAPYEAHSLGSGFVLSSDGYILTNYHVIKDADEIIVRFSDRNELQAKVLGSDERSDVALLKVEATGLEAVKLGDSTNLKVGEWVLAIGSPFGFDHSATAGIISALGRSLPSDSYVPFIQTDVAINPGNSGGPLFNLDGEVIGINSQIYSRTGGFMGLSFAIPMDVVMDVVDQIKSQGFVSRGWLGVVIQDVTRELAESFGLAKPQGALISKVLPDSPSSKAGFKAGDVILKFDGKDVASSSDLPPIVGRAKIGATIPVEIMRNDKRKAMSVVIEQLPDDNGMTKTQGNNGGLIDERLAIEVADLDEQQREQYAIPEDGVLVASMKQGPASAAGMRPGDIIMSINNQKVKNTKQFLEIAQELPVNKAIPVLIQRGEGAIFLAIKIDKKD